MRKKHNRILAGLLCGAMLAASSAQAVSTDKGQVLFTATEPDASGCFTVQLTMDDVSFIVYQFALRYNSAAAVPVDSSGQITNAFGDFAEMGDLKINELGTGIDKENGFFEFTGYIMPGTRAPNIVDGLMELDGETVYTFHFKQVSDAPFELEIATASETEPYQKALPSGAALLDKKGDIPSSVVFDLTALAQDKVEVDMPTIEDVQQTPVKPAVSTGDIAERLSGAIVLQLGNYGAVVDGKVVRIDPDSTAVKPYAHDNRTFVPVRFLSEQMGATVGWDQATKTVTISRAGRTVKMVLGQTTYWVDGVIKTMDAPAEVVSQRTMVPIRFVSEALGLSVGWDQANKLVLVTAAREPWNVGADLETRATEQALNLLAARDFI